MANLLRSEIILVPIQQIHPHPDNPRKDVGDVTELAESIRANGILQNLTVVPGHYGKDGFVQDEYTVIIGHRRLAASKAAGLAEVPCVIAEMSLDAQVATMLTENMQRSDLTIYEQAKAFQQLSLDFGMSVAEIAEMSGFSEATVRRRTKLADLNEVAFKRACERGATLFDFAELDKLETPEDKAKVLADMGTSNFRNTLKETLAGQKFRHKREEWLAALRTFATQIEKHGYVEYKAVSMNHYREYGSWNKSDDVVKPDDAGEVRYFFVVTETKITVYKEMKTSPEEAARISAENIKRQEDEHRWKYIQEVSDRHKELRREFVENFGQSNKNQTSIARFASEAMIWECSRQYYSNFNLESVAEIFRIPYDQENRCLDAEAFAKLQAEKPMWVLLVFAYWYADRTEGYIKHDWNADKKEWQIIHKENKRLDKIYQFLESIGYEMSDEERQLADGTHELFYKEVTSE